MIPMREFRRELREKMKRLGVDESFARRYLNEGFSGGEKKRAEILQLAMLEPKIAILDETDSGLDIDAVRIVGESVNRLIGPDLGVVVITHYPRLLSYIRPQFVHILLDGRIVESGGWELAELLERRLGFAEDGSACCEAAARPKGGGAERRSGDRNRPPVRETKPDFRARRNEVTYGHMSWGSDDAAIGDVGKRECYFVTGPKKVAGVPTTQRSATLASENVIS